jgi:superfamily II DNA or RNA helicase
MSRLFTQAQKIAVELVTGRSGEADHVIPWSKGGKTTVENCQLINKETNQKKAAFMFEPREWQSMFFELWGKRKDGNSFMLMAVPGSGKTMAAIEAARRWMEKGTDRRLIVVVPTDNLRTQWQQEARRFGI